MQVEFERFPFAASTASGIVVGDKSFVAAKHIPKIVEEEKEELPPPPPTFSEQELEQAKEEAYRKGFNDGENKGKAWADSEIAKTEQAALELTPTIIENVTDLFAKYNKFVIEQKEATPRLSLAIAKKLTGGLPEEHFFEQVAAHAAKCAEQMLGEPEIRIYVHPTLSNKMEERLTKHFANSPEPGDIIIHPDDKLAINDCKVEWASGGMVYQQDSIQKKLEEMIGSLTGQATSSQAEPVAESSTVEEQVVEETPQTEAAATEEVIAEETENTQTNVEVEPVDEAVASAIANQLADHEIPPIPELPEDSGNTNAPLSEDVNSKTPNQGESNE